MSSSSYYYVKPPDVYHRLGLTGMQLALGAVDIRSQLTESGQWGAVEENERGYIDALQEGVEQMHRIRDQIFAHMNGYGVTISKEAVVADIGLGDESYGGVAVDASREREEASKRSTAGVQAPAGVMDFSNLFARKVEQPKDVPDAAWLSRMLDELARLTPLTDSERSDVAAMADRCKRAVVNNGEVDSKDVLERLANELVARLSVGGDNRKEALGTYLALCRVMGEETEELPYPALLAAIERLQAELMRHAAMKETSRLVNEAMAEVGLRVAGTSVMNGKQGTFIVADGEDECGLFMHTSEDGSVLFTTLSAQNAEAVGREGRARILASARRICDKKDRLIREALARRGLEATLFREDPVTAGTIRGSTQMARFLAAHSNPARGTQGQTATVAGEHTQHMGVDG